MASRLRSSSTAKSLSSKSPSVQPPAPKPDPPDGLLEIGLITKPHGLNGEVTVRAITNQPDRFAPTNSFESPRGKLTVTTSRRHGDKWLVRFTQVADRSAAESLAGCMLWAEPIANSNELWVHELIGCIVIDQRGTEHGKVLAVQKNPASDLLELADGHLVPLTFVVTHTPGQITVDVPDGLFEINRSS